MGLRRVARAGSFAVVAANLADHGLDRGLVGAAQVGVGSATPGSGDEVRDLDVIERADRRRRTGDDRFRSDSG